MPISRLVAVNLSPASSVRRRTLARTGSVLRVETARLATDRPRARFSCMTESFTSFLQTGPLRARALLADWPPGVAQSRRADGSLIQPIFSSHHHRHHGVDGGDATRGGRSTRPWTAEPGWWRRRAILGTAAGRPVDKPGALRRRRDRKSTRLNSSHVKISYAVFCLKQKKKTK